MKIVERRGHDLVGVDAVVAGARRELPRHRAQRRPGRPCSRSRGAGRRGPRPRSSARRSLPPAAARRPSPRRSRRRAPTPAAGAGRGTPRRRRARSDAASAPAACTQRGTGRAPARGRQGRPRLPRASPSRRRGRRAARCPCRTAGPGAADDAAPKVECAVVPDRDSGSRPRARARADARSAAGSASFGPGTVERSAGRPAAGGRRTRPPPRGCGSRAGRRCTPAGSLLLMYGLVIERR